MRPCFVFAVGIPAVLQSAVLAQEAAAHEIVATEAVRSLRGRYGAATEAGAGQFGRALHAEKAETEAEAGTAPATGAKTPPSHFTARVQFNGTFPGPGSATYRSMTSYWIYGKEHQERFTSLVLTRYLSSGPSVFSKVYDSITTDKETMETNIDVWKGAAGDCHKRDPIRRLVDSSGNYSICRFCPSLWEADEAFPASPMSKGSDETISVPVGAGSTTEEVECETYGWTGQYDALHKVWISKKTGLLVREVQRAAGGPINTYPASAELTVAYDSVLPKNIFGMAPAKTELFAPPAACGTEL